MVDFVIMFVVLIGKMTLTRDYLCPILEKYRSGQLTKGKAVDFVQTQYSIILK